MLHKESIFFCIYLSYQQVLLAIPTKSKWKTLPFKEQNTRAIQIPIKMDSSNDWACVAFIPQGKGSHRDDPCAQKSYHRPLQRSGQSQTRQITSCVPAVQPAWMADLLHGLSIISLLKCAGLKASHLDVVAAIISLCLICLSRQWRKKAYACQPGRCHCFETVCKLLRCQREMRLTSVPRCLWCPDQRPNPNTSKQVFFKMHPISFVKTGLKTITENADY